MSTGNQNGLVTVIVVQRERFSTSRRSLESLFASTAPGYKLIYIDAGSPREVRNYLARKSVERDFEVIREEHYLSPVHARNLGLSAANTKYVAFVDNDVLFAPGWLEALVECAEETGVDVVTPLMFHKEPVLTTVHVAGGTITISKNAGRRELTEIQRYWNRPITEVEALLKREPTGMAEFHCLFARNDLFEKIGPLDENLLATSEHLDFSLRVSECGGTIYFEPKSRITYVLPPPLALGDIPFFSLRWSNEWTQFSEDHFFRKWDVVPFHYVLEFSARHRKRWLKKVRKIISMIVGKRAAHRLVDGIDGAAVSLAKRRQAEHIAALLVKPGSS